MSDVLDGRAVATARGLALDVVQAHGHGHAGAPLGLATVAHVLFQDVLRHDPTDPAWEGRDRFVLSAGHASLLLYTQLYLCGYDLDLDDVRDTRILGSRTPGHPELGHTPGVEMTTGPLGQGVASSVGMALSVQRLQALLGEDAPFDHTVWCLASDGDLQEGVSGEAASLAGTWGLDRLVVVWDDNGITIDGPTGLAFTEDVRARHRAYGWEVLDIEDADDVAEVRRVLRAAREVTGRPVLVAVRSVIGAHVPGIAGTSAAHAGAFGDGAVADAKRQLGLDPASSFAVPDDVLAHTRQARRRGGELHRAWDREVEEWRARRPDAAALLDRLRMPASVVAADLLTEGDDPAPVRSLSGAALGRAHDLVPSLLGGSADLSGSTSLPSQADVPFGIREHAMAAILNGIALHGWFRPYGSTYLTFSDYQRPALRLAALMRLPVLHLYTHDSLAVGEDGPTHQPVEQLWSLRMTPGLDVVRPADAREVAGCWARVLTAPTGPTAMVLARQALPQLAGSSTEGASRGGYVVRAAAEPDVLLLATGSEVSLALEAATSLEAHGVAAQVVSLPCLEWFDQQPSDYRDSVLPPHVRSRVAVEAAVEGGWHRYVGDRGRVVAVREFGLSGDGAAVMHARGITAEAVVAAAQESLRAGTPHPAI